MLTLNDGRSELWQWDTGRTLAVDADCSQVHFSNKVFGRSIDVDVIDGIAIIPDTLLQTDKDLNVWAFVGTAENGYTKISKTFKVNRRNKPADYVFTPPEQTTLAELSGRLDRIEESQDPDAIKNAVEDYMEQNPVEAPIQSVNGKTGDVELTAEDVGAISKDKLQEATNEALAKAKASGEFNGKDGIDGVDGKDGKDGYTPVKGVDYFDGKDGKPGADGKDYLITDSDKQEIAELAAPLVDVPAGGGSSGESQWTLIYELITQEELAEINDKTIDGSKHEYLLTVLVPAVETQITYGNNNFFGQRDIKLSNAFAITAGNALHTVYMKKISANEALFIIDRAEKSEDFNDLWARTRTSKIAYGGYSSDWGLYIQNKVPAGTHIKIYGK